MSTPKRKYKKNQIIQNWKVVDVSELKSLGAFIYELEHIKTKAKYAHIDIDNQENVFCVAFKTIPKDSTGVAHILEHTVLTGSKNYPVRDPFFSMTRRSLNTFMNAFTSNDWTAYPYATQNKKDFYNLMGVYLDAAFFPLLNELNFKQEGHRLEYEDNKLIFKGVVYNEMKGVYSSPDQIMSESISKALFPSTSYSFDSGGDPKEIPNLSFKQFKDFHKRYYHPSNAYFYSFGNFPLEKHLDFIEKKVMNKFNSVLAPVRIKKEHNFKNSKNNTFYYPTNKENKDKYQVAYAYRLVDVKDSFLVLCFELLEDLLIGSPSAYLRRELINSGLGNDLSDGSDYDCDYKETIFSCGLKDVSQKNIKQVKNLINLTLKNIVRNGFETKDIKAAIHRLNISYRALSNFPYPYGLKLWLRLIPHWLHEGRAQDGLNFSKELKKLENNFKKHKFLESLIEKYLINNKNKSFITLTPDLKKAEKDAKEEKNCLKNIEKNLNSKEKLEIIKDAKDLSNLQNSKEDLSSLPMIQLGDISRDIKLVPEKKLAQKIFAYECQINNLFYGRLVFDLKNLDEKLLFLLPLFCEVLPKLGLKDKDYLGLSQEINLYTGGVALASVSQSTIKGNIHNLLFFSFSSLDKNIISAFKIVKALIYNYDFSNLEILEKYILELKSGFESEIVSSGHILSASLAMRNFSLSLSLREKWEGISQYLFLKKLITEINTKKLNNIQKELEQIAGEVFNKNLSVALVGAKHDIKKGLKQTKNIIQDLVSSKNTKVIKSPKIENVREAWCISSQVSFLTCAFKTAKLNDKDAPILFVLAKLLSAKFLHTEIREKGGAYGGFARYNYIEGAFYMSSYRDPNIIPTLLVFREAYNFLQSNNYNEQDLKEAILQSIAQIDKPGTANEEALREFNNKINGISLNFRKQFRNKILKVKLEDIKKAGKKYFKKNWEDYSTVVITGREKAEEANRSLGKGGFKIMEV
jgi:Zn-dependent M16 (insulinase) family peptidase